jgi:hypothetical protein
MGRMILIIITSEDDDRVLSTAIKNMDLQEGN